MSASAESPLKIQIFRALWIATVISNIGTWMQDVGAGWQMTSLSPSPLMVALVQTATTLPMFVLSLPAGALADIVDRRRLLIATQVWMMAGAATLSIATFAGLTSPTLLLVLVCSIATGMALSAPAFQAMLPEIVPVSQLPKAVALVSLGVNISRAIGPAVGGLLIALAGGPAVVFGLNALSSIGILVVLYRWKRETRQVDLPAERFLGALQAGLRYTLGAPAMLAVLVRCTGFFLFASALWALLPVIGRHDLALSPTGYGGLMAFLGMGAVGGALLLRLLSERISSNRLSVLASLLFAVATALLGLVHSFVSAAAVVLMAGAAWIAIMSALSGAAQMAAPAWVKARTLAIYILVSQGAMTTGATFWGWLAAQAGVTAALLSAGIALVMAQLLTSRFPVDLSVKLDLAPGDRWPAPQVDGEVQNDRGPVMITIEYRIKPNEGAAFADAMEAMRRSRRRDGAISWCLFEDAAMPNVFIETFVVESWLQHLRQHERVTRADQEHEAAAQQFHIGPELPVIRHWIAPK